jgi:DnaJ-class molecular chaperone
MVKKGINCRLNFLRNQEDAFFNQGAKDKMEKEIECTKCDGIGTVPKLTNKGQQYTDFDCPVCGGQGWVIEDE